VLAPRLADNREQGKNKTVSSQPAPLPTGPGQNLRGIACVLVAMLTFATQDAITKTLAQDLAVAQIVMVRYWLFATFATVLIARRPGGLGQAVRARRPWLQIVRSVIFVVEIGVFAWVVARLPLSTALAVFAVCPLMVTGLSPLVLGERVGLRRWLAVIAGFVGVVVILRPTDGLLDPVGIVAVIGALMFATYVLLTRLLAQEDRFETSYGYVAWVGCLVATLVGPFLWQSPSGEQWLALLTLGCTGIFGHMLLMKAYTFAEASVLQPFTYTQLLWGIVIGMAVFSESPDPWMLTGAAIVVGAGLVAMRQP
jgi:drug/metabolite transporter (DMT)-like permease